MTKPDLFENRTERRFLLPRGRTDNFLHNLPDFQLYTPNGQEKTGLQSIYFGRRGEANKRGLLRVRTYNPPETTPDIIEIDGEKDVLFEMKYKTEDGKTNKRRCTVRYGELVSRLQTPESALGWLLQVSVPGIRREEIAPLFEEFDYLDLYPQFAITTNRAHFHHSIPDVNCRITVDQNIQYFAFQYGRPNEALIMAKEPMDKIEIKSTSDELSTTEEVERRLMAAGAMAIDTLQPRVEALYRETVRLLGWKEPSKETNSLIESTPMHSLSDIEGVFINEFEGEEFEMKLQVEPFEAADLMLSVREVVVKNMNKDFSLVPEKEQVSWWTYFMDYYGYMEEGKTIRAFAIVRHPDKNKFMVQYKDPVGLPASSEVIVAPRRESKYRLERPFQKSDLEVIKAEFELNRQVPVEFVGTNERSKFYLFVKHSTSHRYYTIAADQNVCKGEKMVQLEIEYKGKDPAPLSPDDKSAVLDEMNLFVEILRKEIPTFNLKNTMLNKFDWIKSVQGIE